MTRRFRRTVFGLGCLLVVLRCALWFVTASYLPVCVEQSDHELLVRINNIKSGAVGSLVLDVDVDEVLSETCPLLTGSRLRLNWYSPAITASPGDVLKVKARLSKPWGAKNPGGFDYGLWLLGQGYRATGYLRTAEQYALGEHPGQVRIAPRGYVFTGLLNALALGIRDGVESRDWQLFRETGTIHLMVISGLHVGVFAGLVFLLVSGLLKPVPIRHPAWVPQRIAVGASVLALGLLVYQTGTQVAVVRASLMAAVFALMLLTSRRLSLWRCFFGVALVSVLMHPGYLLQQGFWLSYMAVGGLMFYFATRVPGYTWIKGVLASQGVLALVLTPWIGITAGEVPLVGPLANLLVVPLMSLLVIPLAMTGALASGLGLLDQLGHLCLMAADHLLGVVIYMLEYLRGVGGSIGYFSITRAIPAWLAALVTLSPVNWRIRTLSALGWLTLLLPPGTGVAAGEFRLTVLDVGQGSAAIVDTQHHRMLVDAGAVYPSGFNLGEAVVVPALRSTGPDRLSGILISHADNDHAGGAAAVMARYPGAWVSGLQQVCRDGDRWRWDGVDFEVITDAMGGSRNDRSCTVVVGNGRRTVYISGDISRQTERRLLPRLPRGVDVLVAPHHGSATSSSLPFVLHLCPRFVVYSAGRHNRYGHPRKQVMERYALLGTEQTTTGLQGAVVWQSGWPVRISTWRGEIRFSAPEPGNCRLQ